MFDTRKNLDKPQESKEISGLVDKDEAIQREILIRELMRQLGSDAENRRIVYSSYPACNSDG